MIEEQKEYSYSIIAKNKDTISELESDIIEFSKIAIVCGYISLGTCVAMAKDVSDAISSGNTFASILAGGLVSIVSLGGGTVVYKLIKKIVEKLLDKAGLKTQNSMIEYDLMMDKISRGESLSDMNLVDENLPTGYQLEPEERRRRAGR